ncbi:MAG TPA: AI-2E family transporter [Longimicrobiales bacterium]|nr:AI-2E family transporter [Longimicrobiales bacterium]
MTSDPPAGQAEPATMRHVYTGVLLAAFALYLFTALPVLTPIVLFLVLLVLGGPYAHERPVLLLLLSAALVLFFWLLEALGGVITPFVLALVLAYILDPAVDALERRRVPRGLAIVLLALPVLGLIALGIAVGIPALLRQVGELVERAPAALERLRASAEASPGRILGIDLPLIDEQRLLAPLLALDAERINEFVSQRQRLIAENAWAALLGVGRGLGIVLTILGYVVLVPVLTYYLLHDFDSMRGRMSALVPPPRRESWLRFLTEYDRLVSRYLRGQLLAATTVGVLTTLGLWVLGFPYPALVGVVAGVFNLVPYLGLVVSLIPAIIIALLSGEILASFGKIAIVFGVVQALDGTVIGPKIIGGSVGLHPAWVILALAAGGLFLGFVGLLIAVPAALLVKLLALKGIDRYRDSRLFRTGSTERSLP